MKKIIEKIKRIEKIEEETERLNLQVRELQNKKLKTIIEVTKDKFEYSPIYKERLFIYGNHFEYFKNKNGECVKGVCICTEVIKYDEDKYGTYIEQNELFLLEDGQLKVFKEIIQTDDCINTQDVYTRELIENYDISEFYINDITENINILLEEKVIDLTTILNIEKDKLEYLK